jgi:hypothetical protein
MKSPFPGMDPYLEPHWLDVHTAIVAAARQDLNRHLPDDLIASVEERVAIETEEGDERTFGPDVRVFEPPAPEFTVVEATGGHVATKYRLFAQVEPATERFIRVIEAGSERLVTVIEFVSPTNKRGRGLRAFRSKRKDLVDTGVNFVEVDLVRGGNWNALLRPYHCPRKAISSFRVTFRIRRDPGAVTLEPIPLRARLPKIGIPLRSKDPLVELDLQELLDETYVTGRYARRLDYHRELDPPLGEADAAWADALFKAAGKR